MFSPAEYLTNLNQIGLLSTLAIPTRGSVPVAATVPAIHDQCNDVLASLAISTLSIKVAAIVATALIIVYLVKKYGKSILASLRTKIKHILASLENKFRKQRSVYLIAPTQSVVIG